MDDADRASEREDIARAAALEAARRRIEAMPSLGYCYYCGEALRPLLLIYCPVTRPRQHRPGRYPR